MKTRITVLFPVLLTIFTLAWNSIAICGEIQDAAKSCDLKMIKMLLKDHPDWVSIKDTNGTTALHTAAWKGCSDVASYLIAKGAEVNAKNNKGFTPLHMAAGYGRKDVVELLLANKAEVNAKADKGQTPLLLAVMNHEKDVADLLRQHGGQSSLTVSAADADNAHALPPIRVQMPQKAQSISATNAVWSNVDVTSPLKKAQSIRLENVSFNGIPLAEVLTVLHQQAKVRDPERLGVKITLANNDKSKAQTPIKLNLKAVTLAYAVTNIANIAHLQVQETATGILLTSAKTKP